MPPTVLIVDDHASFRLSAWRILEVDCYEIVGEAEDGRTAIEAGLPAGIGRSRGMRYESSALFAELSGP